MNKVKVLSNAVLMSALMSTSVVWGTTAFAAENTAGIFFGYDGCYGNKNSSRSI